MYAFKAIESAYIHTYLVNVKFRANYGKSVALLAQMTVARMQPIRALLRFSDNSPCDFISILSHIQSMFGGQDSPVGKEPHLQSIDSRLEPPCRWGVSLVWAFTKPLTQNC